jgi:hypothetical protein
VGRAGCDCPALHKSADLVKEPYGRSAFNGYGSISGSQEDRRRPGLKWEAMSFLDECTRRAAAAAAIPRPSRNPGQRPGRPEAEGQMRNGRRSDAGGAATIGRPPPAMDRCSSG